MRLFIAVICVLSLAACAGSTGKQQAAMGVQPVVKPTVSAPGRTPVPEPRPAVPSRAGAKKPGGDTGANASAQAAAQQQASAAALAPAVDMDKLMRRRPAAHQIPARTSRRGAGPAAGRDLDLPGGQVLRRALPVPPGLRVAIRRSRSQVPAVFSRRRGADGMLNEVSVEDTCFVMPPGPPRVS